MAHRLGGGQVVHGLGGWVGGFKWSIVNGGQVDPPLPQLCVKGTGAVVGISS